MTIVIDDGSGAEFYEIFSCVEKYENTKVIKHVENLGKGAALKTAFAHIIEKYENVIQFIMTIMHLQILSQ